MEEKIWWPWPMVPQPQLPYLSAAMRILNPDPILIACFLLCTVSVVSSTKEKSDPCLDRDVLLPSTLAHIHYPSKYANLTPPWQRDDGSLSKVIRSDGFVFHWSWMKSLEVKGLGKTIDDVLNFLSTSDCFFVPIGPAVRLAILGQRPVFLSGEVSCDLHELYEKCVAKYSPFLCSLYPSGDEGYGTVRLEIGDSSRNQSTDKFRAEPVVLHEWRSILGAPKEKLRFTVDTLAAYDDGFGNLLVIDPLEKGYDHICDKKLVPTSDDWALWSQNQPVKVLGFFELRSNGFSVKNEALHKFISDEVNVTDKRVVQKFYCESVLKGVSNLEGTTPVCHTKYPDRESYDHIAEIKNVMVQELGPIWENSVKKAAEELEAVFCTDRQFVDIRSRLLHKIPSRHDSERLPEEPKIIEEGRPMINDSAQIHARPILDMNAEPPILPPDYPNSPHARPDENLEMVTPPHVAAGGSDPIAIQGYSHQKNTIAEEDDDDQELDLEASPHQIGKPVEADTGIDYTHHNTINNDIPEMRFDKVEEGDLTDMAASVMEHPKSNGSTRQSLAFLLFTTFSFLLLLVL
ncbi:hypothetical protein B9Z55_006601 [Caenorhabditis nigoni]|uniref:Uncharacterized protein n=1 Tax=Caenorhabditis nigoni TaxID=1611254 RepID=A0A2G5V5T0_9PELO|nr:hypothetical protein B9Z55_006601 [Caenorhabditis nigoni]